MYDLLCRILSGVRDALVGATSTLYLDAVCLFFLCRWHRFRCLLGTGAPNAHVVDLAFSHLCVRNLFLQICVRDLNKKRSFELEKHTTMVTNYDGET